MHEPFSMLGQEVAEIKVEIVSGKREYALKDAARDAQAHWAFETLIRLLAQDARARFVVERRHAAYREHDGDADGCVYDTDDEVARIADSAITHWTQIADTRKAACNHELQAA